MNNFERDKTKKRDKDTDLTTRVCQLAEYFINENEQII